MDYPSFNVVADTYDKLPVNAPIINLHTVAFYLWIGIPHELNNDFSFAKLSKIVSTSSRDEEDITNHADRVCSRPWIRVPSSVLDLSVGQHIYKLELVNKFTNDPVNLYFNYIIQDDDPPKPYNYMNELRKFLDV